MLRGMREGAKSGIMKFILLGLMTMAVGGLVLMDVGGFFRGGVSSNTVAEGSGITISAREFDRTVRRVLSQQGIDPAQAYRLGLIETILYSEIQSRLLNREASGIGLNIGDETVTQQIARLAEPLATGEQSRKDALQQILRMQGISEGEFIASVRNEMATGILRESIASGASMVPPVLAADLYQAENEKRAVQAVILRDTDIKDTEQPSEESLRKYYDANKAEFIIPETRSITTATLDGDTLAESVLITDEDLKQAYEENITAYQKPVRRKLAQAIFPDKEQADAAAAKTRKGASLKDAAGADNWMGEETFERSGLLEEIANPAFAAKQGDTVGPVETALGWHVLQVTAIQEPETTPFAEVKNDLRKDLLQIRLMDETLAAADAMDDRLAGGEDLESVAKDMNLTVESFRNFRSTGLSPDGKTVLETYANEPSEILETAFAYEEGETAPVQETRDGGFVAVRIDNVTPQSYKPFETVESTLKKRWIGEQQALSNRARAQDMLAALDSGKDLTETAKTANTPVKTYNNLTRNMETPPVPLSVSAVREIFQTPEGGPFLSSIENGFIVGRVTGAALPDADKAQAKDLDAITEQTAAALTRETLDQYRAHLLARHKIKINQRLLTAMYGEPAR